MSRSTHQKKGVARALASHSCPSCARRLAEIEGQGILDGIKRFISGPRKEAPPKVRQKLLDNSHKKVIRIQISRQPLNKVVDVALNWISDFQFDRAKQALRYDTVFHTGLICTLSDGTIVRLEKNEVIDISPFKLKSKEELTDVELKKPISLKELMDKAEEMLGKEQLYTYNPISNNCQDFVMGVITGNGKDIVPTKEVNEFVKQDGKSLGDKMGIVAKLGSQAVTNLAGRLHHAIYGKGIHA
jgi:hypothetical protein